MQILGAFLHVEMQFIVMHPTLDMMSRESGPILENNQENIRRMNSTCMERVNYETTEINNLFHNTLLMMTVRFAAVLYLEPFRGCTQAQRSSF